MATNGGGPSPGQPQLFQQLAKSSPTPSSSPPPQYLGENFFTTISGGSNLTLSVEVADATAGEFSDTASTCAFAPNDTSVFVGHDDGTVSLWTWADKKEAKVDITLRCCSPFPVVAIVPCKLPGRALHCTMVIQADGSLNLVNELGNIFEACSLKAVTSVGEVRDACCFADGRFVAIIGKSASILVLEVATLSPTHLLHGHEDWISAVCSLDDPATGASTLVSCGDDGTLLLWKWRLENFKADIKRSFLKFSMEEQPNRILPNSNRRYSVSFGGSTTLLVVSPWGDCGVVNLAQLEAQDNVHCFARVVALGIQAAYFVPSSKGNALLALNSANEVFLYKRAKVKTSEYVYSAFEKVATLINSSSVREPCGADIVCEVCRRSCNRTSLVPMATEGACVLRESCSSETLVLQMKDKDQINGSRVRAAFKNRPLFALIVPDQAHFHTFPTVVVKEVAEGQIGASFLPDWPTLESVSSKKKKRVSKITTLHAFPSWSWDNGSIRVLLVGRDSGLLELFKVKVPLLESDEFANGIVPCLERIAVVKAHSQTVMGASSSPESSRFDRDSRMFCTIGAENDVVVFNLSVDSTGKFVLECLFRFSGHHSSVRSIHWDLNASVLHVRCDKTFFWSLLSGNLERRTGNSLDYSFMQTAHTTSTAGAVFFAHTPTSLVSGTFEGDLDPLSRSSKPRRVSPQEYEREGASMQTQSLDFPVCVPPPCAPYAFSLEWSSNQLGDVLRLLVERGFGHRCGRAYGAALSLLHEWGMDPVLDEVCRSKLGMEKTSPEMRIRFCYKQRFSSGAIGTVVGRKRWNTSDMLTAIQDLGLVALFLTATTFQSAGTPVSDVFSQLVTAYGIRFPDTWRLRGEWQEPSLAFLARQALVHERKDDLSSGNYVAARLLLQRTVECMTAALRTALATEWSARLNRLRDAFQIQLTLLSQGPNSQGNPMPARVAALKSGTIPKKSSTTELSALESETFIVEEESPMDERLKAMIVTNREYQLLLLLLAVVGVVHPEDVSPPSARLVTEALVEMISLREAPRAVANQGSNSSSASNFFQNQIRNTSNQLNQLSRSSTGSSSVTSGTTTPVVLPSSGGEPTCINPAFAAELLAKGFALFRPHIPHMSRLIKKLLVLATDADDIAQRSTAADRALSEVGAAHPVLFLRTIGAEACKKECNDSHRRKCLEVLVNLVKSFPVVFLRHLPLVAEVVIKTLDPSDPAIRSCCLMASTMALQELVKRYPMVSFHQNSQRFAVGTVESQIIVYDLRTATKWRVLEGTEGAISAIAFERDGEKMASYCAAEHAIRIWATRSPGLFGSLLTIRGTFLASVQLPKIQSELPEDMTVLKECRLEWTGPSEIRVRRETGQVQSLRIDV